MRHILLILTILFSSCSNTPNSFSPEANEFLNTIDGKNYNGLGAFSASTFQVTGTLIAQFNNNGSASIGIVFQNTLNNGASTTQGIYRQRGGENLWLGVVVTEGGYILQRTPCVSSDAAIDWSAAVNFAQQQ
ncbi:MAG: hypothetical protein ACRCTQ_05350 [Brevinemataceae bacterium]